MKGRFDEALGEQLLARARLCSSAQQQGTADAVVNDVFRGDPVSKEGFWERGGGTLQNCLACCVFEKCFKVLEFSIIVLFLAQNPGNWQGMWRVWD